MVSGQHRFHGHNSLSATYRHGLMVRNQQMALKFAVNKRRRTYRAAVIVSRKVHKDAVSRNRVRRRLYEIIRTNEQSITGPYDIILTVFSEQIVDTPAPKLTKTVTGLLSKAGILGAGKGQPAQPPRDIVKT